MHLHSALLLSGIRNKYGHGSYSLLSSLAADMESANAAVREDRYLHAIWIGVFVSLIIKQAEMGGGVADIQSKVALPRA